MALATKFKGEAAASVTMKTYLRTIIMMKNNRNGNKIMNNQKTYHITTNEKIHKCISPPKCNPITLSNSNISG